MNDIVDYDIVRCDRKETLVKIVREMILDDWEPIGSAVPVVEQTKLSFMQTMIKRYGISPYFVASDDKIDDNPIWHE